jgi:hypothetical protein
MPASMTTVDALLKEVYALRLEDQLQSETTTTKRIERTSEGVVSTVGGRYVDFPIRVTRNSGLSHRNENEQIGASGQAGYAAVHVGLKYGYGRVRFTGQVMDLADSNFQAFASAMDNEMEYLKDDIAKDQNTQMHFDGTGLKATVVDAANSATHTVDNAQWLDINMVVDIALKSNGTVLSAANSITDINGSSVTFATAFDTTGQANNYGIYRQGNYGREMTGLGKVLSNTTVLHGLDPAVQRKWAAYVDAPGGTRALSEGLMIATCDAIRRNGGKVSVIITSLGVRRAYFNLLTQQRRYTDTKNFDGGFQGLAFNYGTEIPVVEDVDAPPNGMKFLEEDKLKIFREKEWSWLDKDGTTLKWVRDFDAWEGILHEYHEMGTTQRNAHGFVGNITEG